jgi:hypothetical protein
MPESDLARLEAAAQTSGWSGYGHAYLEWLERRGAEYYTPFTERAAAHARVGHNEEAIRLLQEAAASGEVALGFSLRLSTAFSNIQDDERFIALRDQVLERIRP